MWENAKLLDLYLDEGYKKGLTYLEMMDKLELIGYYQASYGDWKLYRDTDGNLWEDYFSIGD